MELEISNNECPYCKAILHTNKRVFANHVRWCIENPNRENMLKSLHAKLCGEKVERKEHIVNCEYCGKEYSIICSDAVFNNGNYRKTCSDLCAKRLTNQKAGDKKCIKISETLKERYAKTIEGYDCTEGKFVKICPFCGKTFYTKKNRQIYCSRECANKDRTQKAIELNETFFAYKKQCKFNFPISTVLTAEGLSLLKENGWYKAKNHGDNLNGVSRDHIFSIKEGFRRKIDPYYISHPANCVIILQAENASKRDKCGITKEELIQRILEWEAKNGHYNNTISYYGIEDFQEKTGESEEITSNQ